MTKEVKLSRQQKVTKADYALAGRAKEHTEFTPDKGKELITDEIFNVPEVELVSEELIKKVYPIKIPPRVVRELTETINKAIMGEPEYVREFVKDNMVGLLDVMKGNNTNSFKEYVNAAKFITYKQMGDSDYRAYIRVFPDRVKDYIDRGTSNQQMYVVANRYASGSLVVKMRSMLMFPAHIMYQDVFHKAVQTQCEIMLDTKASPKVRSDAANSLMTHLKQPEVKKAELQISTQDTGAISELAEALSALSDRQSTLIREGKYTVEELRNAEIIKVDSDE